MPTRYEEYVSKIVIVNNQNGKENWFSALCPICGWPEEATTLNSTECAKTTAKSKILMHLALAHGIRRDAVENRIG